MTEKTKKSEADKIWDEISSLPMDMYSLPNQTVKDHISKLGGHEDGLIVRPKSPAALPALEAALDDKKYQIQTAEGGYIMVCRTPKPLVEEEEYILFPRPNGKVDKVPRKKLYNS